MVGIVGGLMGNGKALQVCCTLKAATAMCGRGVAVVAEHLEYVFHKAFIEIGVDLWLIVTILA